MPNQTLLQVPVAYFKHCGYIFSIRDSYKGTTTQITELHPNKFFLAIEPLVYTSENH